MRRQVNFIRLFFVGGVSATTKNHVDHNKLAVWQPNKNSVTSDNKEVCKTQQNQ